MYCKKCNSCGESGCCSALNCFSKLIVDSGCKWGEYYLNEYRLDKDINEMLFDSIDRLKSGELDKMSFLEEVDKKWSNLITENFNKLK
jgi:hypothetical protein